MNSDSYSLSYYFVDEAGDSTIFDRRGRVIIGTEGCSRYFILAFIDVPNPIELGQALNHLRHSLLQDPYFAGVPSMQPQGGKTSLLFHAKDDIPKVRREVFALLRQWEGLRFYAVVRDKQSVLNYVRQRNQTDSTYHYRPNDLYEAMAGQLLRQVLHRKPEYHICFASRGYGNRTRALRKAIHNARADYLSQRAILSTSKIRVIASASAHAPCLQATDYFLWALQRLYERGEDRYLRLLWHTCRWVWDLDDVKGTKTGVLYTQRKPLTMAALAERQSIL